jgi:ferritin-like metal-binding protein YciE
MEVNNSTISNLGQLLTYDISECINAENQLKAVLPDWINKANSPKLKVILERYMEFVRQHVQKMEDMLKEAEVNPLNISSSVMDAYIKEAEQTMFTCQDMDVRDAALLAGIQAINHFKISTYGTAAAFAKAMNMEREAEVFYSIDINEKHIDDRLSQLAEHEINIKAKDPNLYLK